MFETEMIMHFAGHFLFSPCCSLGAWYETTGASESSQMSMIFSGSNALIYDCLHKEVDARAALSIEFF